MALWSWFSGETSHTRTLLAAYGDEGFVHYGSAGSLTAEQREQNLAAFEASIERRVARWRSFAAALGTPLPEPAGQLSEIEPLSHALDALVKNRLSAFGALQAALAHGWCDWAPEAEHAPLCTLAIDLGTYCGELGIRCAPQYRWTIDNARYTARTLMPTAGRVVIGHRPEPRAALIGSPIDPFENAAFALREVVRYRKQKALWRPNYFAFLMPLAQGRQGSLPPNPQ
jgi:hypothetical protein